MNTTNHNHHDNTTQNRRMRTCATGLALACLLFLGAGPTKAGISSTVVERLEPHTDEIVDDLMNTDLDWVISKAKSVSLTPDGDMVFTYGDYSYDSLVQITVDRHNACNKETDDASSFEFSESFEKSLSWTQSETVTAGASLTATAEYTSPYGYGGSVSGTVYGEYSETSEESKSTTETTTFGITKNWTTPPGFWTYAQWQIWDASYDELPFHQDFFIEDVGELKLEGELSWEDASKGDLPSRAIAVGENDDGARFYACRASRGSGEFIGKVSGSGKCKFYDDGDKQVKSNFEVLVGSSSDLSWTSNTSASTGVTGVTENDKTIYLCRSSFDDGSVVPGWTREDGKCKVIKNDEAKERSNYKLGVGNALSVSLTFSGRVGNYLDEEERIVTNRGEFEGEVGLVSAFVGCDMDCDEVEWGTTPTEEYCDLADSGSASLTTRSTGSTGSAQPLLEGGEVFQPSSVKHQ